MAKTTRFFTALFTVLIFLTKELFAGAPFSLPHSALQEPYTAFSKPALAVPSQFGTIDSFKAGKGPLLIHLQTAHGDYEAQKNIQAILHYLKQNYGIKLILVEGSAFKLEPEILRFFPDQMDLTMKIADALAKKALVKGAELFLLENPDSQAYGIENIEAYRANREAFQAVLSQREKTEAFLTGLDSRTQDLRALYFNRELNLFFKQWEEDQKGRSLPQTGVTRLETEAKRHLDIDLSDPAFQIDWPMLVRVSKLKELEKEMNRETFEKERGLFLGKIRPFIKRGQARSHVPVSFLFEEIEKLLSHASLSSSLPDPETGILVEQMVKSLPAAFDFNAYPAVRRFLGMLMLQSEIKGERLIGEMSRLQDRIFEKLARTKEEKQTLELFKRYELLRKLFALELSPEDYKKVLQQTKDIYPETLVRSLLELGKNKQKSRFSQADLAVMNALFAKALEFYRRVTERDSWMIKNIEKRMKLSGADKAVVITGGFHAQPLRRYFESRHFNFASITPKITQAGNGADRENYIHSILQDRGLILPKSTLESDFAVDGFRDFYGSDEKWLSERASRIAQPILAEARYAPFERKRMTHAIVSSIESAPERSLRVLVSGIRSEIRNEEDKKEQDDLKLRAFDADLLPYPVFHKNLAGQFTYANKEFAKFVGLPVSEILGKMDFEIEKYPKHLVLKYRTNDQWVGETGQTFTDIEDYVLPNGKKIFVKVTKTPVRDSNEQIVGIQGIFWDVTVEENAKRRLAAEHAVMDILAKSQSLEEAAPEILKAIGANLGLKFGAIWKWDNDIKRLRNLDVWYEDPRYKPFEDITRATTFPAGIGLPGRLLVPAAAPKTTPKAVWIIDVTKDSNFPRAPFALQVGLHGAFAFLIGDGKVVFEFFSDYVEDPDQALLDTVTDLGLKTGQLIKQAETQQALKKSERHRRRALEAAKMATWEWNVQKNKLWSSENVGDLLGVPQERLQGTLEEFLENMDAKDRDLLWAKIQAVLKEERSELYIEYRIIQTNDRAKWFAQKGTAIRNGNGEISRLAGTIQDITDRKLSDMKHKQVQAQLTEAEKQAEKQAALVRIIGPIAHVFNNKLTSVLGFTELAINKQLIALKDKLKTLQDQFNGLGAQYILPISSIDDILTSVLGFTEMAINMQLITLKDQLKTLQDQFNGLGAQYSLLISSIDDIIKLLKNPLKEAHIMKVLVEDLMIYADISMQRPEIAEMDIHMALRIALSDIKNELGVKEMPSSVRIEEHYDFNLPKVKTDITSVAKALTKIISNGIEAGGEAGGTLTITTQRSSQAEQNEHIEILVQDTGSGIDEETVKKGEIFNPFYTTKFLGRGLGLPVAKRLIEKFGGRIEVESTVGKGTIFKILLPLNPTQVRSEIRAEMSGPANKDKDKVKKSLGWIKNKAKTLAAVAGVALLAGGASLVLDLHEKAIHVIELFGERTTAALVHGAIAGLIFYIFRLYRKAQREIKLRVQLEEDILKSTEVIRESDAIQRTVINTVDERIFFKDYKHKNAEGETGFFVQVNVPFARDFGFEPDELKGKTDYVLLKPKDPKAGKAKIEASIKLADTFRANDMEVLQTRKTITRKERNILVINGKPEERILETTKKPVIDDETDEAIGVLGTYKDITEREKQEQQLRESRALLQGILDALPFVILERDVALKPQYANARAAIFFGLDTLADRTQAQGVFAENPEFSKKYQIENERIIKSGEAIEEDEEVVIAGRGKIFHKIKHPLFSPEGEILGLVEIYQDVTEEREMFERLTHAEVLEANDQAAKELAHDVNNLLTGVLANIEEASTLLKKGISAQEEMDQATADLNRVVEVVRELRKQSEAGAKTLTMLKLAPIVTQSVRSAKSRFPSIEFKPPTSLKNLPYIMGNAQQILRAVSNILWNAAETIEAASQAVEATSEKKGVITVTLDRVHLEQPAGIIHSRESFRPGTYLEVAVHNTGPAISEDVLAKMLNVLQEKTKDDFTTKPLGSGKGLLVVRNAVLQNHEGMIDIKTSKDHGTTFHLYFFAPNGGPKPSKIWIIHDIFKIQQGILNQLKEDGYQALPFNNIQAAIDFAKDSSQLPELIIYKEDEKAKIPATLTILKQEVPGKALREVREVAVPRSLYQGGSWPKRPNKDIEEFIGQIKKELASRKKTAIALPVAEVQREIEKKKEMPEKKEKAPEKKLNVLIVDDYDPVGRLLVTQSEPYSVKTTWVKDGIEAIAAAEKGFYDVVFLDLNFPNGTPEDVAAKIRQKGGEKTQIIITSSGEIKEDSPLLHMMNERLPKPFRKEDVESLLRKFAGLTPEEEKRDNRSEMRLPKPLRIVIEKYRGNILPLRLEADRPEILVGFLRELLGRPVYAEKAGIIPVKPKTLLPLEGRIITTGRFQPWLKQIVDAPSLTHSGRAIFDSAWLDSFLENPRSLYLLLKSFEPFEGKGGEPFIAFVGDAFLIKNKIRLALERQNNGLTAEEKIEAQALVKDFEQLVKILLPEQVAEYVPAHENGVAILRANESLISKTPFAAHFILDPHAIAPRDVPVVALTAPALLKAAALIRGVPSSEHIRILKAHMEDIFPGVAERGNVFVIAFASYLTQTLQKNEYIATQA